MSAPPPVPARKGFFHTVKAAVAGPSGDKKTVVAEFEDKRTEFTRFHEDVGRIESEIKILSDRYNHVSASSMNVWEGFLKQYGTNPGHPGALLSTNARTATGRFNDVDLPAARELLANAAEQAAAVVKDCVAIVAEIKVRDAALHELDYYNDKYQSLIDDRDKTLAKGKSVKPADLDKIDRNLEKKNSSELEYNDAHSVVTAKLDAMLSSRFGKLEPIANTVIQAQNRFSHGLSTMSTQIKSQHSAYEQEKQAFENTQAALQTGYSEAVYDNPFAPSAPVHGRSQNHSQADYSSFVADDASDQQSPPNYQSPPAMYPPVPPPNPSHQTHDYSRPPPMVPRQ